MNPNDKKSPEVIEAPIVEETLVEQGVEEQKKIEQQAEQLLSNENEKESFESGFHTDRFNLEVEELQKKIESKQVSKQEADKLYDEIAKRYDKGSIVENITDAMGMRDKVTDKRNIKNSLLWLGGAVAGGFGLRAWRKKRKEKKEGEKPQNQQESNTDNKGNTIINVDAKEKKSWWQRNWGWLAGGGAAVGGALYFKDKLHKIPLIGGWLDGLFNPQKISFETAFTNFESDIKRGDVEKQFKIDPKISYEKIDNKKIKLKSYNKEIIIDTEKRTVEGMEDVIFPNYSELLHAANMINFSAAAFQGICRTDKPFSITRAGGDIEVQLLDKGDEEVVSGAGIRIGKITGGTVAVLTTILGAVYGGGLPGGLAGAGVGVSAIGAGHMADTADALSQYCPTLNDDANKQKFRSRLNTIPNLTQGNQNPNSVTESELKPDIQEIIKEIEDTLIDDEDREYTDHGNERVLDAVPVLNTPDTYDIKSWNNTTRIIYKDGKVILPDMQDVVFNKYEGIKVANLTNKLKSEYSGRGKNKKPFVYRTSWAMSKYKGLYIKTKETHINWFDNNGYQVLREDTLKKSYPSLLQHIESHYIPYLHKMRNENNNNLWAA